MVTLSSAARMAVCWAVLSSTMLLRPCAASVQTSKLQILIPSDLRKEGGYAHKDALFGIPPYGGSIQQQIVYVKSTLCSSEIDKSKHSFYPHGKWPTPFILMVDRGECTFVQKVRNAQRAGASAVLIADNLCLCDHDGCVPDDEAIACETEEPIMADDGSGSDITIPSFLVFKEDADEIKKVLKQNTQVRAQMSFKVPSPDSRVEYDLWTHPSDVTAQPLEKIWSEAAIALAKHASFTPHLYVYDGLRAGCQDDQGNNICFNLCTNSGRYCSTDPDDDLTDGASGADVVIESLRRICMWNLYGKADGIGESWWKYVDYFIENCDVKSKFNDPTCFEAAMTTAGVDAQKIATCMENAGGVGADLNATNALLEKEIADQESSGVVLIPSLVVNGAVVRGSLSFSTVLKAVCSGFASGSEPLICQECANCPHEEECVKRNGQCPLNDGLFDGSVSLTTFGAVLLGMILVFVIGGVIQHRRQQAYMQDQIRGIVQEYMPVTAQSGGTGTSLALDQDDGDGEENGHSTFSIT